jgi:hypothetical protein
MTQDLIARLEAAMEGSRELDELIDNYVLGGSAAGPRAYTTSIDAALMLVPEGWVLAHLGDDASGMEGNMKALGACCELDCGRMEKQGMAATRPLACCIAALKARQP